jgi:glycosyltransferase involved in cell wall biosynthesis
VRRVLGKLEPGGAQLALLRLSRELQRRHGVKTQLLVGDATPDGIRLASDHGVPTVVFRTSDVLNQQRNLQWQRSWRFAEWLSSQLGGADLVHAHMVGAWWAVAQVIDADTPFIATEHNQVNWSQRRIRSLRSAAARINRFYAMGPAARQFALDADVQADVIRAARSPVAGLTARPRAGLQTPRVTFAGRFCDDKGPDLLVEAIHLLKRSDVVTYLLGDGPMRPVLKDKIDRYGLADNIITPGWVAKPWTYVAGSSAHVVPSREEAWSQSAVLGLGLGVPVIGTCVDGLTDTLSHDRGRIVAPNDPAALSNAIEEVLDGKSATDREGAIRYARQFSPARIADFYYREYQALTVP